MKTRMLSWLLVLVSVTFWNQKAFADPELDLAVEARRQTESIQNGGKDWPVQATEFFRIRYQPGMKPDPVACQDLDRFVTATLGKLEAGAKEVDALRKARLDYYLCSDAMVQKLTGYSTKGMADLAGRAVISSHFPHFHELAHLLVDLQVDESVIQTLPVVQEGIACLLGGRWGRSPEVVLYSGWVHSTFGMGELNEVLTYEAYYQFTQGADVAYPLGTALCELVRREAGWPGVVELNRKVSGSLKYVQSLSEKIIYRHIGEICQWPEAGVKKRLEKEMTHLQAGYRRCGIHPVEGMPATDPMGSSTHNETHLTWWEVDGGRVIRVQAEQYPVFVLGPPNQHSQPTSSYFHEHLPRQEYQGQRYGLKVSPEEVALYDYATNQLLATWVAGFTEEMGACGDSENGVEFGIAKQWSKVVDEILKR